MVRAVVTMRTYTHHTGVPFMMRPLRGTHAHIHGFGSRYSLSGRPVHCDKLLLHHPAKIGWASEKRDQLIAKETN